MIPLFKPLIPSWDKLGPALQKVFDSGQISQGAEVEEFERRFGDFVGNRNVIAVSSCTAALHLALELAGARGGEVVSTSMTAEPTNLAIHYAGARVRWADVDPLTGNVTGQSIGNVLVPPNGNVRAILLVHYGGIPVEDDGIKVRAHNFKIPIIEDCAHALGASPIGWGDYQCFPGTTNIMTEEGWKRIDQIVVGERVQTAENGLQPVLAVHKQEYQGEWARIKAGQTRIVATSNHPIRVHRDGQDLWIAAGDLSLGDSVYVLTHDCQKCGVVKIPFYNHICPKCFEIANSSEVKRLKLQKIRGGKKENNSQVLHYLEDVEPVLLEYEQAGYRVIPMVQSIPDFLAIKDGKIIAVEVEDHTSVRIGKRNKYDHLGDRTYDDVVWVTRAKQKESPRYSYKIVEGLARVPVSCVEVGAWGGYFTNNRTMAVYNLTVSTDPTYFAKGILVHNCYSFQAIKHMTTGGEGGALVIPGADDETMRRAQKLRWFGIDRAVPRTSMDIQEAGLKYNLTNVQAAVGLVALDELYEKLNATEANCRWYKECLDVPGVYHYTRMDFSPYLFHTILAERRDDLACKLTEAGVECGQAHRRNDEHTVFAYAKRPLPGLDAYYSKMLHIPCGWWVTPEDRQYIVDVIRGGW